MTNAAQRQGATVILVLGMHRSGTSAAARMLNLLGVGLGDNLLPPQDDNSKGFWEHTRAVEIHEELLAALGRSWHDIREMPTGWLSQPASAQAIDQIVELVSAELRPESLWAVKDPRMCRLAPLWICALARLKVQVKALLVVRDPREVALSLRTRDGWALEHAYLMWAQHLLEACAATDGLQRAAITYDELLDNWAGGLQRTGDMLGIQWPRSIEEARADAEAFISRGERHHHAHGNRVGGGDLEVQPAPLMLELYQSVCAIAAQGDGWPGIEKIHGRYRDAAAIFSRPLADLVVDKGELERLALERMEHIHGLSVAKDRLENEMLEGKARRDELACLLAKSEENCQQLAARYADAQAGLHEQLGIVAKLHDENTRLVASNEALVQMRAIFESTLMRAEAQCQAQTERLDVQQDELMRCERENAELTVRMRAIEQARTELERALEGAEGGRRALEEGLRIHTGVIDRMQRDYTALAAAKAATDTALGEKSQALGELTARHGDLGRHQDELLRRISNSETQLADMRNEHAELHASIIALKQRAAEADRQLAHAMEQAGSVRWLLRRAWRVGIGRSVVRKDELS